MWIEVDVTCWLQSPSPYWSCVLVAAAALAAVAVGVAGWLACPPWQPDPARGGASALIFGAGLHITYWKPDTSTRDLARPGPASQ